MGLKQEAEAACTEWWKRPTSPINVQDIWNAAARWMAERARRECERVQSRYNTLGVVQIIDEGEHRGAAKCENAVRALAAELEEKP